MTRTVALVMIARNEAARIVAALASARNHVDELVVMDTGSTDATVALARAAGARVGRFAWCDDFAAARNAALAFAGTDWNVVVDADEIVGEGGAELVALRHVEPTFVGLVRVDSAFDTPGGIRVAPSWLPRVLPRGVRYEGRIHEQPVHALATQRMPVILAHEGYRDAALREKAGRNRTLLAQALAQSPRDAYLHYQDGKDHDVYERYVEAAAAFERSRACEAADAPRVAWHHDRVVRELHALKQCKRHAQGVLLADLEMPNWPQSPDFFFALGDLLLDWAADEPQRAHEVIPMIESAWQRCLEIGERPDLEGAVAGRGSVLAAHNLALLYEGTGRPEQAARLRATP